LGKPGPGKAQDNPPWRVNPLPSDRKTERGELAFTPTVLGLLRLLSAHPGGVSRQAAVLELGGATPEGVERALERLLELGVVEARGHLVVPLPTLLPLAQKMERLARRINRQERERDQAMDLVKMLFRGP